MKIEKQKIWFILAFALLLMIVFVLYVYDPYVGMGRGDGVMNMIMTKVGLAPFLNWF